MSDRVLRRRASRQHRFEFLRGDTNRMLSADACYPALGLVIEYRERQRTEGVGFWDRRTTASGITRGEQRDRYDRRRERVLPKHSLRLVKLDYSDFRCDSRRHLLRDTPDDERVLRRKLAERLPPPRREISVGTFLFFQGTSPPPAASGVLRPSGLRALAGNGSPGALSPAVIGAATRYPMRAGGNP